MTNLQTLKLGASSIGAAAPRQGRSAAAPAPVVEEPAVAIAVEAEIPAPAKAAPRTRRAAATRNQLLGLLALEVVATLLALQASGAIHNHLLKLATVLLACAAGAVVLAGAAVAYNARKPQSAAAPAAAPAAKKSGFSTSKAILMLLMVMGIVAYFGGAGTFAGFTAETSNPNSTLASGTLLLNNNTNATSCDSQAGESSNNVNANCTVAFTNTNTEPGTYIGTATVTLTNTGSLNASKAYLFAAWPNAVVSTATGIAPISSLTIYSASGHGPVGVEGTMSTGDLITLTYGSHSQTMCVNGNVSGTGVSSIPVETYNGTSCVAGNPTPSFNFPAGTTVQDTSANTTGNNTDCYDAQLGALGSGGGWNPATGNPLCVATLIQVQEVTGNKNYCLYGNTTGAPTGACDLPLSVSPTATVNGGVVAPGNVYSFTSLNGNVKGGDTLQFSENGNVVRCAANATDHYITDSSPSITLGAGSCTVISGANSGFDTSAVVTDYSTLTTLASDTSDTISQFDINKSYSHEIELIPVTANGVRTVSATELGLGAPNARTFKVSIFIPGTSAAQNQLQNLKSTFGLVWHIDQ